jgi:hypothetical protein
MEYLGYDEERECKNPFDREKAEKVNTDPTRQRITQLMSDPSISDAEYLFGVRENGERLWDKAA